MKTKRKEPVIIISDDEDDPEVMTLGVPDGFTKLEDGTFECSVCGNGIKHITNCYIHRKKHANEKPLKCPNETCTFETFRRYVLRRHQGTCKFA